MPIFVYSMYHQHILTPYLPCSHEGGGQIGTELTEAIQPRGKDYRVSNECDCTRQ